MSEPEDTMPRWQAPPDSSTVVSSGSLRLDIALGIGGVPRGHFVEIFGPESSGKTTLCLHIIAEAQKQGNACAYLDCDHTLEPIRAARCGIDAAQLVICQPEDAEQTLEIVERLACTSALAVIAVDSLTSLVPRSALQASLEQPCSATPDKLLSLTLRRLSNVIRRNKTSILFTNQTWYKRGAIYHNLANNPARLALKLHASLRLELRPLGLIQESDQIIGNRILVKVIKNPIVPCLQSAELDIMYNNGIVKTGETLDLGSQLRVIEMPGSVYSFKGLQLGAGRQQAMEFLERNPALCAAIEQIIRHQLLDQASG